MYQIVCRLGLCPRPHWASLQRSPRPLAGLRGVAPGKGKEGGEEEKEGGERKGGEGGNSGMPKSRVGKPMSVV